MTTNLAFIQNDVSLRRSIRLVGMIVTAFVVSVSSFAQTNTWLQNMESASSMYDSRGYLKDANRTVDGNVSVSHSNGNVQYRYPISQYSVNQVPITFSLSYNQNASYTAFRRYNGVNEGGWESMKQNRPAWIFGLNGFAIQALHTVGRNVLRPQLRKTPGSGERIVSQFSDDDLVWMLDGYDFCNRMYEVEPAMNFGKFMDVIKLLREDGSVLELIHIESYSPEPENCETNAACVPANNAKTRLITGTYVTTDANSSAYAIVTLHPELVSIPYEKTIKAHCNRLIRSIGDQIPPEFIPRRVEYFPGDGSSIVFREYMTPYGLEPVIGKENVARSATSNYNINDLIYSGWSDAAPTIFYLEAVKWNNIDLVRIDYAAHDGVELEHGENQQGRAQVIGFDGHNFKWGGRSLTVEAIEKTFEFRFDECLYSGEVDPAIRSSKIGISANPDAGWDVSSEYNSWTGLITEIIDPAFRRTQFSYSPYTRIRHKAQFPLAVGQDNAACHEELNTDLSYHSTDNHSDLRIDVAQLNSVEDPLARFELSYLLVTESAVTVVNEWLRSRYQFNQPPALGYVLGPPPAQGAVGPLYDKTTMSVAYSLEKWDRSGTSQMDGGTVSKKLWDEVYNRPSDCDNENEPCRSTITVTRTTIVDGSVPLVSTTEEEYARYSTGCEYFCSPIDRHPVDYNAMKIYNTAKVYSKITAAGVGEKTFTFYPTTSSGLPVWSKNYLMPNVIEHYTVAPGPGGGLVDLPRTRTEYSYTFEPTCIIPYENVCDSRACEFKNSFGSPVLTRESITSVKAGAEWQLLVSVRDTFLNLQPEDVETRNYNTWLRHRSLANFYLVWAAQKWTKEEAERQWNEANLSASWNVYGDPSTNDDDFVVAYEPVPIVVGLLQSSATRDLTSMGRIESYVVHTYDVEPTISGPYVTRSSTYGKRLSTKTYGRDLLRGTTTTQTYEQSTHARGVRGLVSNTTNELGASSDYYYFGLGPVGSSSITNHAFVSASKITNANLSSYVPMASPKQELVNVELLSLAARLFEKPTTSRVNVRKPSVGGTTTTSLLSASSYTHFGLSNMTIDQNGYLSTFDYDPIGRLEVAWLPHDYPIANTTDPLAPYDIVETKRSYEIFVDYNGLSESEWLTYHCNDYCSQTPYTTPTSAPLNTTDTHIGYGVGRITNPAATCPCETPSTPLTQNMKSVEQAQNIVPAPYAFTFDYEQSYSMTFSGSAEYVPAELVTVTSAHLRFAIGQTKNLTTCFPLYITVIVGTTVLNQVPYRWMVNCPLVPPTSPGGSQTSSLVTSSNPYLFDIEIDLESYRALLTSIAIPPGYSRQNITVEVTADPELEGAVWFSRIQLDLEGSFYSSERKRHDFTLGLKHDDYQRHDVSTLAKVDDRSQAYDVSRYPSASPLLASLHSRHAKSLVTLTTDDLVRSEVRNFGPDVMGLLGASINGLSSSTRSTLYTGAGVANSVTNERSYVTTTSYDALNRPTQSQGQALSLGWVDIAATNPTNSSNPGPETQLSYVVGPPQQLGIPASKVASFNMYCRREVARVLRDGASAYDQVATFYDARGNKRLVVNAYSEAEFVADIANQLAVINQARNLATWYDYDAFNRVVTVTNPKEQVITYTYDDFGNVATTTQTDNGLSTFSYDRLGNLRFSQTAEQAAARKITYKQYDDLGRPTVIGEAAVATTPEPPEQPGYNSLRLTTTQSSDNLHAYGQALLSVNTTLLQAPVRPVQSIYRTLLNPVAPLGGPQILLQNIVPCPPLIAAGTSDLYNPNFPAQLGNVLVHRSAQWTRPAIVAPEAEFENAALYPEFVLQAIWYDEMPPLVGPVWANSPPAAVWNAMAPRGEVRNLKGRPSIVAYRTHGGQPFHYIVRSYDERGRVEAQLRLTENVGFDAVYYRYNSMNKIISMHVVDATGQHATFYGYDENGRVSKVWTNKSNAGFNLTMTPARPTLLGLPAQPDMVIGYDEADAVVSVTYPEPDVQTAHLYNAAGTLLRSTTTSPIGAIFDQRLSYSQTGLIYQQWCKTGDSKNLDVYNYDGANRLQFWQRNQMLGDPETSREYAYDRIGNRLISETYSAAPPDESIYTYGLVGFPDQANILRAVTGPAGSYADAMTYDPDGSMITRLRDKNTADQRIQTLETYSYDAFNLIERFTKRKDAEQIAGGEGCLPDAATAPLDDFRYRFGPLQEREQKRQYSTSQNQAIAGLMWNYTLLGADAKQLASYNGVQGGFCGQVANTVWIWPVEYNSYGPAQTRIITRPQGAKEFVISDHLGSTRLTLNQTGDILERLDYQPFGKEINEAGEGARTSYIGREKDTESELGFYGVRMYEPEYGRFMSVDPLWGKYAHMQPYQYAANTPVIALDDGGMDIVLLVDKEGAWDHGHAAVLIGNDSDGWRYFSLDGTTNPIKIKGASKISEKPYTSLLDFLGDESNSKYELGLLIEEDKLTDKKFIAGAKQALYSQQGYDVWYNSCIDVVSSALENAGYWGGNRGTDTPNDRIKEIWNSLLNANVKVKTLDLNSLRSDDERMSEEDKRQAKKNDERLREYERDAGESEK